MKTMTVVVPRDPLQLMINSFTFRNPQGGSGFSRGLSNEPFTGGLAQVKVESARFDYESGWHFVAKASNSAATAEYLERVGAKDGKVFFSQFDMHVEADLNMVLNALPEDQVHCTEEELYLAQVCC
ncbi:hypothetical protein ACRCPS_17485 [Pseudomonas aeruginosa]